MRTNPPSRFLLALCGALGLVGVSSAAIDRNQVRFRSVDIEAGLSSSTARDLAQDPSGQIWVATQDGLNRYDGYTFTVFANDPADSHSISANHITSLAVSPPDQLWVGTVSGGLNRLDLPTGRFTRFLAVPDGPLLSNHVADLLVDRSGRLWVATVDGGLQIQDSGSATLRSLAGPEDCLPKIRSMLELAGGDLLLACDGRVLKVDRTSGATSDWPDPSRWQWPDGMVPTALAEMPDGRIMVGDAREGLLEFSDSGALTHHHRHAPNHPDSLVDDQILRLQVTTRGELWIGTFQGLSHLVADRQFLNFRHDTADDASLPANRIPSLLEDRDGLIWVGTWTRGIALHNPATRNLRLLRHRQNDPKSLPSDPVRTVFRDNDGSLWLGLSEGGGLVHLNATLDVETRYVFDPEDATSLPDNSVQSILRLKDGSLWVTTANGGAASLVPGTRRFQRLRGSGLGLDAAGARALLERDDGSLWVGTDDGVFVRCGGCDSFERYGTVTSMPGNFVNALHEDRRGRIWVGYNGTGMTRIDPSTGIITNLRYRPGQHGGLPSDIVTDFMETRSGDLWIGSQGAGIARIIETDHTLRFDAIGKSDGLSANAVGTLMEDDDGRIWVASIVGIDEFDPVTRRIRNLQASDGFDRSGYFIGSCARDPQGRMYFGGLLGLVLFDPKDFRETGRRPEVTLTEASIIGGRGGQASRRQRGHAAWLDELVLAPDESVWTVSFSTMDFLGPENTRYQYRLDGLNDEWLDLPRGQHAATFTHVPAGRYALQVRAQAATSVEFGTVTSLPVRIESPWWRHPIAWSVYAATALLLLFLSTWRFRRNLAERARAQEVIAANERRLKFSLWGSRDELWDYDVPSSMVRRENPLPDMFEPQWREGGDIRELANAIHPDDLPALQLALADHIRGRSEYYEATFRARNLRGEWVWFLQRGKAVVRDEAGRATHLIGTTRDITSVKHVEDALRQANEQLEARVLERTRELTEANDGLKEAMTRLTETQSQLIEAEKLASLGGLVAGVAHEINTPLGICITAASHLKQSTEALQAAQAQGRMTRSELEQYEQGAIEAARLILKNLERAVHLVRSFKQVAVDQGSEEKRTINLAQYLEEVAFALKPMLKRSPFAFEVDCPPDIVLDTYPGAIYQIVANFVGNSIAHAFPHLADTAATMTEEGLARGRLYLRVLRQNDQTLVIEYSDDGVGAGPEVLKRIFEPFFTTKRGRGGSGLGMHIVYNLVTKLLNGSITVRNRPGLEFRVVLPIVP